jgi:succinoglycan biosynthesis protein ExoA
MSLPPVSVVMPAFQESRHIEEALRSLVQQDYPRIAEILVIDGGSTDGTREIVMAIGGKVRLIDNPRRYVACAMNIGVRESRCEIIVRTDAHSHYEPDYVRRSVEALLSTNAAVVGGNMSPVGETKFGEAVALVTTSPLGIGPGKFHYSIRPQEVDTVYLGCFRKSTVEGVGGYDEINFARAGEDQELNFRIRRNGGKIWLDPNIRSTYRPRNTPGALFRQYHNYGLCKAGTWKKHGRLPHLRPLIPSVMVIGVSTALLTSFLTQRYSLATTVLVTHLLVYVLASGWIARRRRRLYTRVFGAIAVCHWSYGIGFIRGFIPAPNSKMTKSAP